MVTERGAPRKKTKRPAAAVPAAYGPGTLGEWLTYLGADISPGARAPLWPPDTFAIGAALLRRTGGYVDLVNGCHTKAKLKVLKPAVSLKIGNTWRASIERAVGDSQGRLHWKCPPPVSTAWRHLARRAHTLLADCRADHDLTAAAVNLCIMSDVACAGLGITDANSTFSIVAESLAMANERRSYCLTISPSKLAVLGKQHTPQRGCSIRSLTHNLALYTPTEIQAYWPAPIEPESAELDVFNILILPWPIRVDDGDFSASAVRQSGRVPATADSGAHRYFDYAPASPESPAKVARRVAGAIAQAAGHVDRLQAVVLPELALNEAQYLAVERVVAEKRAMLVSGVRLDPDSASNGMPVNACAIQPLGLTVAPSGPKEWKDRDYDLMRRSQFKHHRWCLDRRQVMQYKLGARLPASRDCWERTYIGPRDINFVTLTSWLTICTLICEDLARQEPVAEVVRAVGPNLVFALLMDGPQLRNRWPSRYASVLAEDPGSSILSITSLGMSRRSEPTVDASPSEDKRNTIALWRDAVFGEREIAVGKDDDACVLSLVCKTDEEFTIDGRSDNGLAHFPVYAGHFSFNSAIPPRRR